MCHLANVAALAEAVETAARAGNLDAAIASLFMLAAETNAILHLIPRG